MSQNDDEKWKKVLTPEQYYVTRQKGTERPYTSEYLNFDKNGKYVCICCGAELFTSDAKFNSHCGWPAFYKASKNEENVTRTVDKSHGMIRTEVTCSKCGAHLGHVFEDGPEPTGERFCINGVSINFVGK
ncbi:peptide-methionine (R)-S-oxide reductase [Brachionus plicatilis]|uniref:Peptide-methionine (R)-S-oxide reductase n=1 Tax=Brachionus plicatilis TaxID=10195 RepID=A0A3M7QJN0_BRAPC|nr:peptide-methionine (R)-S-oxide reductase [Brachionus plicatilis]